MTIPLFTGDINIFPHIWDLEINLKGQSMTYDIWFDFSGQIEEGELIRSGHDGEPVSVYYDYIDSPKVVRVYRLERTDVDSDDQNIEDDLYAQIVKSVEEHIETNSDDFLHFLN